VKRRDFITMLCSVAVVSPVVAMAQQRTTLPTIGFLGPTTPDAWSQYVTVFVRRLQELGWTEGRTVVIEYRWGEGRTERFDEIAVEFARLKVDVIVTGGVAVPAAKQATSVIPIVFAVENDPVGAGFVASLARPGGNVTGLSVQSPDLVGKRLDLLRELIPSLRRLAIMANVGYPAAILDMREVQAAGRIHGLDIISLEIRRAEDIGPALEDVRGRADAVYICTDALVATHRLRINTIANAARLPTMHSAREYVAVGGLISYGPSYLDLFRRAATYVDKILRGAKPADLPVEQPTRFDLVINLTTAKTIGLTIPESFLLRADEVIE
jgi:putative ABC transport system substrate-binding protein